MTVRQDIEQHVSRIYPDLTQDAAADLVDRLEACASVEMAHGSSDDKVHRQQTTNEVALITYGDTFHVGGQPHLKSLAQFLDFCGHELFTTVHVLPFFPSSSDGGFSIVDYDTVAAELGTWQDLRDLGVSELMVDLVCNHGSAQSAWFADFLADREPGRSMYLTADPNDDVSAVVRPRTHPLLTRFETEAGTKHVWTTFSQDQVDFDFSNPDVLVEFCRILTTYLAHGATRVRLDAIAYLWKEIGTPSIHHPRTHQIVKLMRTLMESCNSDALMVTETNVPHQANVSYFGDSDEAHVVYNFTLAPLIVWSLLVGRADRINEWLIDLDRPPAGCAFFNFLASHDGIGLRPLEGLVSSAELEPVVDAVVQARGGYSSYTTPDGSRPYELNVSLVDLLAGSSGHTKQRFVLAHTLLLALQGIPAIYVHSLLASPGDPDAALESGHKRDINRARIDLANAVAQVQVGWRGEVFTAFKHLIGIRQSRPEFATHATQKIEQVHPLVTAVRRGGILALHNMSGEHIQIDDLDAGHDLISGCWVDAPVALGPWQAIWLTGLEDAE